MKTMIVQLMLAVAFVSLEAYADAPSATRKMLLEQPVTLASPAVKARVIKVTFAPGFKTPLHTHDGPGPRYILKGQLKIEEGGQAKVYGPGEVFWETGNWMTAENTSADGEAELIIFELAPQQ